VPEEVRSPRSAPRAHGKRAGCARRLATGTTALWLALGATASPYHPTDEAQVLERLPGGTSELRRLKSMRLAAARTPTDVVRATMVATAYVRASRLEGDPRFTSYAQAALSPWWSDPNAPNAVLMLRATIRQSRHEFPAALADLDQLLSRDPANPQALLTRATVLTVLGEYAASRSDCGGLRGITPEIYPVVCLAAIDSVTGRAAEAYESLQSAMHRQVHMDPVGRAWAETLLGEIAHRRGDPAAEGHFRAALEVGEPDFYLLGAYSDWLLERGRAAEVIALLKDKERVDPLLLRLALAQRTLRRKEAAASIEALGARFEAARARGDTVHQRENARFELLVRDASSRALALALDNWRVQREPADLLILVQSAAASRDSAALELVRRWLTETGFEYPAVAQLLEQPGSSR
jgi:tetratricopeptide (TPR) repeat protein